MKRCVLTDVTGCGLGDEGCAERRKKEGIPPQPTCGLPKSDGFTGEPRAKDWGSHVRSCYVGKKGYCPVHVSVQHNALICDLHRKDTYKKQTNTLSSL